MTSMNDAGIRIHQVGGERCVLSPRQIPAPRLACRVREVTEMLVLPKSVVYDLIGWGVPRAVRLSERRSGLVFPNIAEIARLIQGPRVARLQRVVGPRAPFDHAPTQDHPRSLQKSGLPRGYCNAHGKGRVSAGFLWILTRDRGAAKGIRRWRATELNCTVQAMSGAAHKCSHLLCHIGFSPSQ
jgi:hypothetical protein